MLIYIIKQKAKCKKQLHQQLTFYNLTYQKMNAIKEYQEMCIITRKNGDDIQTTASLEQLEQLINN
jgi:hypothetical protein